MKKLILLAVVAVAVTSASCRKDHTCTCNNTTTNTVTPTSGSAITTTSTDTDVWTGAKLKKGYSRNHSGCHERTITSTSSGTGYTSTTVEEKKCTFK